MQRPQQRFVQDGFVEPAFCLHAAENAGKQQKIERRCDGGFRHHQRGGSHRGGKCAHHGPLRAAHLRRIEAARDEKRHDAAADQPDEAGHQHQSGQKSVCGCGAVVGHMDVEGGVAASEQEQRGNGDVVALVAAYPHGLPHAVCGQPEKQRAGQCGYPAPRQKRGDACQHIAADNRHQEFAAHGRLSGPSCARRQQEGDNHCAAVAPHHFVRVPKIARHRPRAGVAEAPQQNGNNGIQRAEQIERPERHRPHGVGGIEIGDFCGDGGRGCVFHVFMPLFL